MRKIFILSMVALALKTEISAQSSAQLQWLAGTWIIQTPRGTVLEQWKIVDDSTLSGHSMFITDKGDSIPQEKIEIVRRMGDWFYVPTVANQNSGQPVKFKCIFLKDKEVISENPTHDFPQRISYRRINDSLYASIEGISKGKFRKQNFDFVRSAN